MHQLPEWLQRDESLVANKMDQKQNKTKRGSSKPNCKSTCLVCNSSQNYLYLFLSLLFASLIVLRSVRIVRVVQLVRAVQVVQVSRWSAFMLLFVVCRLLLFVVVCSLLLFAVCRCLSCVIVCHLSLFVFS